MRRFQIGERGQIGVWSNVVGGDLAVGDERYQHNDHIIGELAPVEEACRAGVVI